MPENDFEKQVQQKMDGLRFNPSDATWVKLEKQIATAKKRRRMLLWIPLFFLLTGGLAWIFFAAPKVNRSTAAVAKNKTTRPQNALPGESVNPVDSSAGNRSKKETIRKNSPVEKNASVAINTETPVSTSSAALIQERQNKLSLSKKFAPAFTPATWKNKTAIPVSKSFVHKKEQVTIFNRSRAANSGNVIGARQPWHRQNNDPKIPAPGRTGVDAAETKEKDISEAILPVNDSAAVTTTLPSLATDSNASSLAQQKSVEDKTVVKSSDSLHAKIKTAVKKSWTIDWGIAGGIGSTGITDGLPNPFTTSRQTQYNFSSATGSNGSGSISNPGYTSPSAIKTNLSWNLGIFISTSFGRTFRVSSGLYYTQYATHMDVGSRFDSTGAIVYRNDRSVTYTNRSHFIELPVLAEHQFGAKSRFSINGGFSFSFLTGTNTLLYSTQKNIYYADKSQVNATQWNLLAGFNYRLMQKKTRLELGPRLSYALGHNFRSSMNGYGHWYFVGFQAKLFLGKLK